MIIHIHCNLLPSYYINITFPRSYLNTCLLLEVLFMVLEGHLKVSLRVILTECFNTTGDLSLNFFYGHVLLFLLPKHPIYSPLFIYPLFAAVFIIL